MSARPELFFELAYADKNDAAHRAISPQAAWSNPHGASGPSPRKLHMAFLQEGRGACRCMHKPSPLSSGAQLPKERSTFAPYQLQCVDDKRYSNHSTRCGAGVWAANRIWCTVFCRSGTWGHQPRRLSCTFHIVSWMPVYGRTSSMTNKIADISRRNSCSAA